MKIKKRAVMLITTLLIMLFLLLELIFRPRVLGQSLASTLYKMKRYQLSEQIFTTYADKGDDIAAANLAKSRYRRDDYPGARSASETALEKKPHSAVRNYDAGNAAYRMQDYEAALKNYRKAMLADPQDMNSKANYELTQRKMQQNNSPQSQSQPKSEKNEQKQEDIRNILNGLDNKESSDRKQDHGSGAAGGDNWW